MAQAVGDLREREHARPANAAKEKRAPRKRPDLDPVIHAADGY
jgi:hypothetical protein